MDIKGNNKWTTRKHLMLETLTMFEDKEIRSDLTSPLFIMWEVGLKYT